MNTRARNALIIIVALVALLVVAVAFGRRQPAAVAVAQTVVKRAPFSVKLPENGVVMRPQTITVPTLVAGNIASIDARPGQYVAAGELMASIENPTLQYDAAGARADYTNSIANVQSARIDALNARATYQGQVETARSQRDEAKRVYDADVALLEQKAIASSQVDADKSKYDQAQVAYDQALEQLKLGAVSGYGQNSVQAAEAAQEKARILNNQNEQQLAFTRVTAPVSGIVQTVATQPDDALRALREGDPVTAGQALFTMSGGSGYIVKAQVDEQDIINVRVGQRADVSGQDFPGKTLSGHVSEISPVATKSSDASSTAKQVLTTIAIDRSPSFLRDGMSADIDIYTTYLPEAIVVSNDAIHKSGTTSYVWLVKNGSVHKRTIAVGLSGDTTTQVRSGLAPGDVVVNGDALNVRDGIRVTALPSPAASP